MLKVALDFDCVLADTISVWVKIYNKKYKKSITKSDIILWDLCKLLGISEKEVHGIFEIYWSEWENLPPTEQNIADNVEEIRKMSSKIEIVTSAEGSFIASIKEWLHKIGKISSINIINCPINCDKACLDYDLFIDDSPKTASSISEKGKICLLYDQPWNRNEQGNNIIRINHLSKAVLYIKNKNNNCKKENHACNT